jgi:dolichol-phosphate mannosyltransferase
MTGDARSSEPDVRFGVVVPVYNEPRLALLLEKFDFRVTPTVVVVDDGSTDGSTAVAERYPVTLLRLGQRSGVGAALRAGVTHLRKQGLDVAVIMAGNNKDDPADIPALVGAIARGADYVQGSRYLAAERARGTPVKRRLLTRAVAWLWSARFLRRLTDVTNGFRAYRLSLLDHPRIDLSQPWLDRYELEYYLHYKVLSLGYRYGEVPVWKRYPADGLPTSKIKLGRDLWSLMRPIVLLTLHLRH